ncbi:hypothetical protein CLOM_g18640 [Closterium sp. NIES-68]|nr:hypothetical protein CLOM_g18640 [Closterium sp. NIES-68]GJP81819.1 hypothetical protein CLOP_g11939 [Closterium sp. NIES-67]
MAEEDEFALDDQEMVDFDASDYELDSEDLDGQDEEVEEAGKGSTVELEATSLPAARDFNPAKIATGEATGEATADVENIKDSTADARIHRAGTPDGREDATDRQEQEPMGTATKTQTMQRGLDPMQQPRGKPEVRPDAIFDSSSGGGQRNTMGAEGSGGTATGVEAKRCVPVSDAGGGLGGGAGGGKGGGKGFERSGEWEDGELHEAADSAVDFGADCGPADTVNNWEAQAHPPAAPSSIF